MWVFSLDGFLLAGTKGSRLQEHAMAETWDWNRIRACLAQVGTRYGLLLGFMLVLLGVLSLACNRFAHSSSCS